MCFEAYAARITPLKYFDEKIEKIEKFQAKNTEMKITTVNKVQFSSLNNKRYNLSGGIPSLCFGPLLLLELRDKKKKGFSKNTRSN